VIDALRVAWEATDRWCSKWLCPFLPELVRILKRNGEIDISKLLNEVQPDCYPIKLPKPVWPSLALRRIIEG